MNKTVMGLAFKELTEDGLARTHLPIPLLLWGLNSVARAMTDLVTQTS